MVVDLSQGETPSAPPQSAAPPATDDADKDDKDDAATEERDHPMIDAGSAPPQVPEESLTLYMKWSGKSYELRMSSSDLCVSFVLPCAVYAPPTIYIATIIFRGLSLPYACTCVMTFEPPSPHFVNTCSSTAPSPFLSGFGMS